MTSISEILSQAARYDRELPPTPVSLAPPVGAAIAGWIDHTLLKPEATVDQVKKICQEALEYQFASVCVNPVFVPLVAGLLHGSPVKTCAVVGFPLGATITTVKVTETLACLLAGATEIDMVMNIGALKGQAYGQVLNDIQAVVQAVHNQRALVKVILETALLTRSEKIIASLLCKEAGADFVKTSTGFGPGGATVEDIALMRRVVGPELGVKASGGIRNFSDTMAMIQAGATRIGASAGVAIVKGALT